MDVHGTRARDLLEMDVEKGLGDEEEEELTFSAMLGADLGKGAGRRGMGVQRTSSTTLTGNEDGVAKVEEEKIESRDGPPKDLDRA